jgi:hypothetical protein
MARALRPGPASLEGLRWLARVGPAPLDAWRCAMGWSEVAARSHARRLEQQGWLARYPMTRGEGSLFVATRTGNRVLAVSLRAAGPPGPTWWAHHCGCAWMAAWLGLRGHPFLGDRELLEDRAWSGEISWQDRKGYHDARHRPDLVGINKEDGWAVSIEVELAQKSIERLRAILWMHAQWRAYRRAGGVIYVCGDQDGCERVRRVAEKSGSFPPGSIGLRIELLDTIKRAAIEMSEQTRAARSSRSAGDLEPADAQRY